MKNILNYLKKLIKTEASPASVALGFATGTFVAILPTPGFGIFVALFLAFLFKKINKAGILVAFSIWNPLVLVPTYWFCYYLGDLVFEPNPSIHFSYEILNQVYHYSGKFLIGNGFVAVVASSLCYYVVFTLLSLHKEKKDFKKMFRLYRLDQFYKVKEKISMRS